MLECTWKTCCLITTINQGSNITSEKLPVLFCSAWSLPLYCKILNEKFRDSLKEWKSVEVQQQNSKNILVQSSWKTSKIQMLIISEIQVRLKTSNFLVELRAWYLSPYQISWILVRVRWKIPILLDHLTWNDPENSLLLPLQNIRMNMYIYYSVRVSLATGVPYYYA